MSYRWSLVSILIFSLFFLFSGGNHRKSMVENLDASLKRLGIGYLDVLWVHMWECKCRVYLAQTLQSKPLVLASLPCSMRPHGVHKC
jgi:hypothetical protein